jgi:hypothetical protein
VYTLHLLGDKGNGISPFHARGGEMPMDGV